MSTSFFIARRFIGKQKANSVSKPVVSIAIAAIALGMAVMIVALSIVTGFKQEIRKKVIGFGAHIQVSRYDLQHSVENEPISMTPELMYSLNSVEGVEHIQPFATKAGIIKAESDIQGVVLKGVTPEYEWKFFAEKIVDGSVLMISDTGKTNNIIISRTLCNQLKIKLNDEIPMYFIQDPPRVRKFHVAGIFDTGLAEFDKLFVFCDYRHIQKLNNWDSTMVSGFEIFVNNFDRLEEITEEVFYAAGAELNAQTIKDLYPQIFEWLNLQDVNVQVIIILMIIVAVINMISALLILILERTTMIGVLKAVGAGNGLLRRIFLYKAIYIAGKGMFWGNIAGLIICIIQFRFHVMTLPEESYYVDHVPISLDFLQIVMLNAGTLGISVVMLLLPSMMISGIRPVKAIRFA
ncbi:MAG: ABC transporter permease [Bacteroidetes bacterium]|nr:ABC transporter permease [Bacteroidota bacterium]MBU1720990.1 ABC transporter permease [Bacteroidota bacterium]